MAGAGPTSAGPAVAAAAPAAAAAPSAAPQPPSAPAAAASSQPEPSPEPEKPQRAEDEVPQVDKEWVKVRPLPAFARCMTSNYAPWWGADDM